MNLQEILQQPGIWRGRDHCFHGSNAEPSKALSTGYAVLDTLLPEAGWPRGALTEILFTYPGQGELRLLLPALKQLTREQQFVALISPPWIPYAPALFAAGIELSHLICIAPPQQADRLWALEQVLRSGHCRAVLAWPEQDLSIKALRRLQLAAATGQSSGFLFRPSQARRQHSPATLRLLLKPPCQLDIFKCRGRYFAHPVNLPALAAVATSR